MLKKITIGLSTLLSIYSAGTLARTPVDVNVPSYNGGFTFGLAGLYLRPSAGNLDYAMVYPSNVLDGSLKTVDVDYDWGYRLNIGYQLPGTGNDISVTYSSFNHAETNATNVGSNELMFAAVTPVFTPIDSTITHSNARSDFKYQAVDVDFGQSLNVGCNTQLRFLGGLRFADLDNKFDVTYQGTFTPTVTEQGQFTTDIAQKSEFVGVGPRFGLGSSYALGNGFNIVGQATAALLVGDFKSKYVEHNVATIAGSTVTTADASFSDPKSTRVVPNMTAKLGLDYNYAFCNGSHTQLTIEAGYQMDHFFNVAERLNGDNAIGLSPKQTVDASFDGPYVGVQVHL